MTFLAKARSAWGEPVPSWIAALAMASDAPGSDQTAVARRIGVSPTAVRLLIANRYVGGTDKMKSKVEAALSTELRQAAAGGWGATPPDWIAALAEACRREPQTAVARRLDYSGSVVSQVLANTYKGDLARVEAVVRGALMGAEVDCPVNGPELPRDACVRVQERELSGKFATNALTRSFRAACPACPHYVGKRRDSAA